MVTGRALCVVGFAQVHASGIVRMVERGRKIRRLYVFGVLTCARRCRSLAMLIPKAHKIAVYSKLFNGAAGVPGAACAAVVHVRAFSRRCSMLLLLCLLVASLIILVRACRRWCHGRC